MANRELSCRLFDENDQLVGDIPDFVDVQIQDQLNDECAWKMNYARNGLRATQLIQDGDCYVQFFLGGTKLDFEGVIEQDNWDEVNEADYITVAGRGHAGQLEYALVMPKNGVGSKPAEQTFTNQTPGKVFRDLFNQAKNRGALEGFTVDFTDTLDSSGNAWSHTYTLTYKAGVNLLDVLKNLAAAGYADFRMNGKQLKMYNPRTTLGGQSGVVFRRGREIASAPRSRDRRSIGTSWLIEGDDETTVVRTDETAVAARGLKERYLSQGGTKDSGTLSVVGDTQLLVYANARFQKQHTLNFDPEGTSPIPWINYKPGQYVDTDLTGSLENFRLVVMNITMGSAGVLKGEVTLNDVFAERQLLLDERIKNLTGGSAGGGVSTQPPTQSIPEDTTTPKAPTNLGATSEQYDVPGGVKYSQVTATWDAVTQNTDNSVYNDHSHYEFEWWYTETPTLKFQLTTPINTMSWSSLRPGKEVGFHVRAVDVNAHRSVYSADFEILTADDTTPPPKPSAPVVSNWLSTLRVQWDGLGDAGEVMPLDFKYVEVWYSPNAAFSPGDVGSVLYDYLPAKGASIISGLAYGFPYYVRFVAVDSNDNRSPASDVASASTQQVVSTDIGGNVIDFSNIRFKDVGNLVADGSFELATTAAIIGNPGYVEVVTNPDGATAAPSPKVLQCKQGSGTLTLTSGITVSSDEKYAIILSHRGTNLAGADKVTMSIRVTKQDGSVQFMEPKVWDSTTNLPTWSLRQAFYITIPANSISMDIRVVVSITTATAVVLIDELEVRQQQGTVLIEDAAISNAKIANLAVNDAKIASASVGKLITGTLTADVTVSSRIKTADTGARAEMNSGGFGAWNSSGVQTFMVAGATGNVSIVGNLRSGTTGRRIDINPLGTGLPEIRFYPTSGSNFGFINAFSSDTDVNVGVNSGQFPMNGVTSVWRSYMTDASGWYLEGIRSADEVENGPQIILQDQQIIAQVKHVTADTVRQGFWEIGRDHAWFGLNNPGDGSRNWIRFNNDARIDVVGRFRDFVAADSHNALFTGSINGTSGAGSIGLSFGPTMLTQLLPLYSVRDNVNHSSTVSDSTAEGFSVTISPASSGSWSLYFWCFRI